MSEKERATKDTTGQSGASKLKLQILTVGQTLKTGAKAATEQDTACRAELTLYY